MSLKEYTTFFFTSIFKKSYTEYGRQSKGIMKTQIVKTTYPQVPIDAFIPTLEEVTQFEVSNNHLKSIFRNGQKDKKDTGFANG